MNMTKRMLAVLLVLCMTCVLMIGCDKTPDTPGVSSGNQGNTKETEGSTQAPAADTPITQYGNYATDKPVRTLEEIFAAEIKYTEDTFATGSTYSDETLGHIYKIADYIANYQKYVEEYEVQDQFEELYEQTGFTLDLGFGAAMIKHYIDASGETYDYTANMEELLAHPKVAAAQTTCISAAMKAAENLVKDGQSGIAVNQTQPMNFTSLKSQDGTIYYALGTYHTMADLSNVQRSGDTLSATVTFRIVDYYDWAKDVTEPEFTDYIAKLDDTYRTLLGEIMDMTTLEGFCQADLAQLHYAGFAQNYLAHGTIVYNVTWTAGQGFNQATVTPAQ